MFSKRTTVATTTTNTSKTKSLFAGDKKVRIVVFVGILLYILLIAGAVAMFWAYGNYKNEQNKNSLASDEWVPTEYSEMNEAQISAKLYKETGQSLTEILDNRVDKDVLPTFSKAYSAARAMYYLGHYNKSLEIYALADTYKSKDKTYTFYLDYADAGLTAEKYDIYYSQMDTAKSTIINDKKINKDTKDNLITTIDEKLNRIKAGQVQ